MNINSVCDHNMMYISKTVAMVCKLLDLVGGHLTDPGWLNKNTVKCIQLYILYYVVKCHGF